jgi:hypothetical protein
MAHITTKLKILFGVWCIISITVYTQGCVTPKEEPLGQLEKGWRYGSGAELSMMAEWQMGLLVIYNA